MDPLSTVAACIGLASGIATLLTRASTFVMEVKGSRKDLDLICRELVSLQLVLGALKDDEGLKSLPQKVQNHIAQILLSCDLIVQQINDSLLKLMTGRLGRRIQWSLIQKEEMNSFRKSLEANKSALDLALNLSVIKLLTSGPSMRDRKALVLS